MEFVGAALGHHDHLCAAADAQTATRIIGLSVEFLDAFYRRRNGTFGTAIESFVIVRVARGRVSNLASIQEERILIAARSGYLPAETTRLGIELLRHGERLEKQQAGGVPLQRRQGTDLFTDDSISNRSVQGLQLGAGRGSHF